MKKYGNSSYWLQDWDDDNIVVDTMSDLEKKSHDLYKLAASKRAIANFVNIVTNKQIPVRFSTRGESYTDGKTVVIGADVVEPTDFDVAVGLALHEGSHIKLSDFTLLTNLYDLVPAYVKDGALKKGITNPIATIKDVWNYIEDRRIDNFVFTTAPGYRDYYRAMYDKYFNDKIIDKGLLSDEYTEETVESYMFRLINLHNKNTNLSKLKGLREIYKLVGLGTIDRLTNSNETLDVALDVFKVIMNSLPTANQDEDSQSGEGEGDSQQDKPSNGQGNGESREMTDEEFDQLSEELENRMKGQSPMSGDADGDSSDGSSMDVEMPSDIQPMGNPTSSGNNSDTEKVHMSDRQKELLAKKIKKQKEFLNGNATKKKSITKTEASNLNAIEESGSEIRSVGQGIQDGYGNYRRGTECIVVRNLTKGMFESEMFPMTSLNYWNPSEPPVRMPFQPEVAKGIQIGTILGKKLQVRGEDRSTVFNRQKVGKIDRRMISSLGFGNENVFQYMETDSYKKANLHVSIDASGSMGGTKWEKTMTNVVALCKAVDMISNLSIQVTFRTTQNDKPYVVMAYDSRKDKFSKVKQFFPGLHAGGTTPEGLCFEAIMGEFLSSNNDMDSYFLNISDGEPFFGNSRFEYSGRPAFKHTGEMVKKMQGMGIKTLSYYVEEGGYGSDYVSEGFRLMYGKSAVKVDITNISQITKTMNNLFLQK